MEIKLIQHGSPDYETMVALRMAILRKPLGLTFSPEQLAAEKNDLLIVALVHGKIEGCCVLTHQDDTTIRLRQMAVSTSQQGKGVGKNIITFAEHISRTKNYKTLMMHARKTAIRFYEKMGYSITGDEFIEVTIPHYAMEKNL